MNEFTTLVTLATVHFVALMSPGPDFALVVQNSTRHGRETGLAIAFGLSTGILIHSILSLTGISYLVHSSPALFFIVEILGGSYLLYIGLSGIKGILTRLKQPTASSTTPTENRIIGNKKQAFLRGLTTNLFNPKALVFFISLMSSLVPATMSLHGKLIALFILWSLSLFWFSLLAWALSTQRVQQKILNASIYIDSICCFVLTLVGGVIVFEALTLIWK
ncbi:LysE family translocator [Vibrio gallicus]|uniref:LysE family translocator n=1 Tax=Vibrio gallicus TaxID=190897 RepID=UPI0021C394EA|nr:LysE family translocator [Vibrio gallicus]